MFKRSRAFAFPKAYRLLKTDEYSSVFNLRRSFHGTFLQVWYKQQHLGHGRLGMVVGKKIAKRAVARNYMKRTLRELFRLHPELVQGVDWVIRVKKSFSRPQREQVHAEWAQLLRRASGAR